MHYFKKIESLEEKASIQVAIGICQASDFKKIVLSLEERMYDDCIINCDKRDEKQLRRWDRLLEKHCQNSTKALPLTLKHGIQGWVNRIALDYLSYCRRQGALCGLSLGFMVDFITREDWSESGRLNEKKLAKRLVKDERLTEIQRCIITCTYCLRIHSRDSAVLNLWMRFTENLSLLSKLENRIHPSNRFRLLTMRWDFLDIRRSKPHLDINAYLTRREIQQSVADGNRVALKSCWRSCDKTLHQRIAFDMAFHALEGWLSTQPARDLYAHVNNEWRINLVTVKSSSDEFLDVQRFILPFYYSDLLCFFLSQMTEVYQLNFFQKAIRYASRSTSYVMECFLEWPHQEYFLPTVRKLWGILPLYNYGRCLLILASKYSGDYDRKIPRTVLYTKEDHHYDYQNLLFQFWEETPENYRSYLFRNKHSVINPREMVYMNESQMLFPGFFKTYHPIDNGMKVTNEGRVLLPRLLKRHPFREDDEQFFKRVFSEVKEKRALIHAKSGEKMCFTLADKGNWPLIDWLLEACLKGEEIPNFKKRFIKSRQGIQLCFYKLDENHAKMLDGFINWSFESNEERKEFKEKLIYEEYFLDKCKSLVCEDNVSKVESMMDFCLSTEEMKEKFRIHLANYSIVFLLKNLAWERLDRILEWSFDSERKIVRFKEDLLFLDTTIDIHYGFLFQGQWANAGRFYEWFGSSAGELKTLMRNTVYSDRSSRDIIELLHGEKDISSYLSHLRFCLPDEEITNFQKNLESMLSSDPGDNHKHAKERLDNLINELLDFRKNRQNTMGVSKHLDEMDASLKRCELGEQGHNPSHAIKVKRTREVTKEDCCSRKRMTK